MAVACKWAPVELSRADFYLFIFFLISLQHAGWSFTHPGPGLYIKATPLCERRFWMRPMCAATSGGSWLCVPDCELWQTLGLWDRLLFERAKTRHKRDKSVTLHVAASSPRPLSLPPSHSLPILPFFLSHFHPLLMCDTSILNILFPVFWSIGFTCRWVGNLHRLKGLPSLLMLSDNGVSIHPRC